MKVLAIDVGGSHVKALASGRRTPVKLDSGPDFTPSAMARAILGATSGWEYDAVTIGYPGPVSDGRALREPYNIGGGWRRFDYERAFGCPVKLVNDAAMQAVGSYQGKRMLFLGLGTGLGSTLVRDGVVVPLELAHLPYHDGRTYEEYLGQAGLDRIGKQKWRKDVARVVALLSAAVVADYTVLGGGNVRLLRSLPPHTRRGDNANAFRGGYRAWREDITWT